MSISYAFGKLGITTENGQVLMLNTNGFGGSSVLGKFGINTLAVDLVSSGEVVITNTAIEIRKSQGSWNKIPIPAGWQIIGGHFANASVGLIATSPRISALEATLNGGQSWTGIPVPFIPFSLDPLSETNWWVVGETSGPLVPNPYKKDVRVRTYALYHTINAGKSWTEFKANWGSLGVLVGAKFYSPLVGYVWTMNTIFFTSNGGATFVSHQLPDYQSIPNSSSLAVGTGGRAWIVADSYPVFETKDEGATWLAVDQ